MVNLVKKFFSPKNNWKELFEAKSKECTKWEFKFNKLQRQLEAVLKESKNS